MNRFGSSSKFLSWPVTILVASIVVGCGGANTATNGGATSSADGAV